MAFQIRISPDGVRAVSQHQYTIAEEASNAASKLSGLTAELGDAWDGGASGQVIASLHEICKIAENIIDGVRCSAEKLTGVAQAFETFDGGGSPFLISAINKLPMVGCPAPMPQLTFGIAGGLRIVPEQVRGVAVGIKHVAEIYAEAGHNISSSIDQLSNEWEGNAYSSYAMEAEELVNSFEQMVNTLDEYAGRIGEMATRYEELDASLASMF